MYSRDEPFLHSLECYFGIYFPRCFATREINTKITLWWALKRFVTRVHTLFSIYAPGQIPRQQGQHHGCWCLSSSCRHGISNHGVGCKINRVNSSPPIDAYMCQWIRSVLVRIMACCLFSAQTLSKPMPGLLSIAPLGINFKWNFNQNTKLSLHKNAYENIICKNGGYFFQGEMS